MSLLPDFRKDWDHTPWGGQMKLVEAFVMCRHPLWFYNNAVTMTLWALAPGRDGGTKINLKVTCWTW